MLQLPSFLLPFVGHTEAVIVATAVPETECNCGLYDAPSARSPPLPLLLWIRIQPVADTEYKVHLTRAHRTPIARLHHPEHGENF